MSKTRFQKLAWSIIEILRSKGGSGSIEELDQSLGEAFPDFRETLHGDGPRTELQYRSAWARTYLKKVGALENSDRGVWTLTPVGRAMTLEQVAKVPQMVAGLAKRSREVDESTNEERLETGPPEWKELLLETLLTISSDAFERLCQRVLRESGFTKVDIIGRSGDGGIDGTGVLRVNLLSFHVLFQCKRYRGSVGASVIRDFRGAMVGRSDKGLVMTTGSFTADARKEATRDGAPAIDLIDGDALAELLKSLRIGVNVLMVEQIEIDKSVFGTL